MFPLEEAKQGFMQFVRRVRSGKIFYPTLTLERLRSGDDQVFFRGKPIDKTIVAEWLKEPEVQRAFRDI